jgi:hypothetical protein
MAKVTGKVFRVFEKEWPSKFPGKKGNKTYSIKLEDDPIYYRTPKEKYEGLRFAGIAEPGNMVTFDAEPINEASAQINGAVTLVEQPKATPAAAGGNAGLAQTLNLGGARDASIQYQSSRKDALEFVGLIVKAEAVKLPAKPADKLQALEALVDHYTAIYLADIGTQGAVARANGVDEKAEDAGSPARTAGDEE